MPIFTAEETEIQTIKQLLQGCSTEPGFHPRCPFSEIFLFLHPQNEVEYTENLHRDHFTCLLFYRKTLAPFSKFIKKKRQRGD